MATVIHVISIPDVVDIDVVRLVPGARPILRPWINHAEPKASVLKSGVATHNNCWSGTNPKPVCAPKMCTEAVFGNVITAVSPAFVPSAVLMLPMRGAMIVPHFVVCNVLFVYFTGAFLSVVHLPMCLPAVLAIMLVSLLVPAVRVV